LQELYTKLSKNLTNQKFKNFLFDKQLWYKQMFGVFAFFYIFTTEKLCPNQK